MLLLDTSDLPRDARGDAFRAAVAAASAPCRVEHLEPAERIRARMHRWQFGTVNLFTADASGFRLVRTPAHVRMQAPPILALAFQSSGVARFAQFGRPQLVRSTDLMLSDLTAPYSFSWTGAGGSRAFHVPHELLGLPVDVVRRAAPRLPSSPLHGLVLEHLQRLARGAGELSADPGAAALGSATVELVRALIISAAGDDRRRPWVREETLLTRVLAFVGQHLADPDLTTEAIAARHNVSVRRLYQACAEAGLHLEQWIIEQRLAAARTALTSPAGLRRSIAGTARGCGFASPSHFARRFRQAYGMTPREWQRAATCG